MREINEELKSAYTDKQANRLRDEFDTLSRDKQALHEGRDPLDAKTKALEKKAIAQSKTIEERVEAAAKRHKWGIRRAPGEYARLDFDDHFDESKLDMDRTSARYKTQTPEGQARVVSAFREAEYNLNTRRRILPNREGMMVNPNQVRGMNYHPELETPGLRGEAKLGKRLRKLGGAVLPGGGARLGKGSTASEWGKADRVRHDFRARRAQRRLDAKDMFREQMVPVRPKQKHGPKKGGPLRIDLEDLKHRDTRTDYDAAYDYDPRRGVARQRGTTVRGYHGTGFELKKIKPVFHFGTYDAAIDRLREQAPTAETRRVLRVQVRSNRMSGSPLKPMTEGTLERQDMMYLKPHKLKQMPRQMKKADLAYYLNDVEDAGSTTAVAMKPSQVKVKDVTQVGTELPTKQAMWKLSMAEKHAKERAAAAKVHPAKHRQQRAQVGEHPARNMGAHEDTAVKAITKYKKKIGFDKKSLSEVNFMEERITVHQEEAASKTWGRQEHKTHGGALEPLRKAEAKIEQKRLATEIRKNTPIREPSPKLLQQQAPQVGRLSTTATRSAAAGDVVRTGGGFKPKLRAGGLAAGLISGIPAMIGEAGEHRMANEALKKQGLKPEAYSKKDFLRFMRDRIGVPQPTHPRDMGI